MILYIKFPVSDLDRFNLFFHLILQLPLYAVLLLLNTPLTALICITEPAVS